MSELLDVLKLLDGSISLKFLLETKLQFESFETSDDLLGFQFKSCDLKQWFLTFFDAFFPWLILDLFIPPLLHNFRRVAEKVQTSFLR